MTIRIKAMIPIYKIRNYWDVIYSGISKRIWIPEPQNYTR